MLFPDDNTTKRYYTIGEVAEMFEVSTSLIRFWESEFDLLKPHKNSKGERRFTLQNIKQLREIYTLVKERGFTLKGAKKELENKKKRLKQKKAIVEKLEEVKSYLEKLKENL